MSAVGESQGAWPAINRPGRVGVVTLLAAGLLVANTPAVGGSCVVKVGPVGAAFV